MLEGLDDDNGKLSKTDASSADSQIFYSGNGKKRDKEFERSFKRISEEHFRRKSKSGVTRKTKRKKKIARVPVTLKSGEIAKSPKAATKNALKNRRTQKRRKARMPMSTIPLIQIVLLKSTWP